MKKPLYLFLALLFPGLIFVFLKYAGKNEFTVPVFYEKGAAIPRECGYQATELDSVNGKPFTVSPALRSMWAMNKDVNVIVFPSHDLDCRKIKLAIEDEIGKNEVWFEDAYTLTNDSSGLSLARKCEFLLKEPFQSVLVDNEGKIRGYYDLRKREEIDKLRVELKILLKKY